MSASDKSVLGIKKPTGLDWVKLEEDMETVAKTKRETNSERFQRKLKENPFVPLGNVRHTNNFNYFLFHFIFFDYD